MRDLVLDFESYYDKDLTLKKLSTSEYVRDPRLEVMGASVWWLNEVRGPLYLWPDELKSFLNGVDWTDTRLIAHNMLFDGFVLHTHYGHHPARYACTLAMSEAILKHVCRNGLTSVAQHLGVGKKIEGVLENLKGVRLNDLTPEQREDYAAYANEDCRLCGEIFKILDPQMVESERELLHITLRAFCDPQLVLDLPLVVEALQEADDERAEAVAATGYTAEELSSNTRFVEILQAVLDEHGETVPTKWSEKQQKMIPALAKSDEGMYWLREHEDPIVRILAEGRIAVKSTIGRTRAQRMLTMATTDDCKFAVAYNFARAHTDRWTGANKMNAQNFKRGSKLRQAIRAPEGYMFIAGDLSQIEPRMLATLAGETWLVDAFRNGEDPYNLMASDIYNVEVDRKNGDPLHEEMGFLGKCLAEGTLVLCKRGWIEIENVTPDDRVWDGEEWICHQGSQLNGTRETLNLCGLWLTPDHRVWCGNSWQEARALELDSNLLSQALAIAAVNSPSWATSPEPGAEWLSSSSDVLAQRTNTPSVEPTSSAGYPSDAQYVPKKPARRKGIGGIAARFLTMGIERACSIASRLWSGAAITPRTSSTSTTEAVESQYTRNGETTGLCSSSTARHWTGGKTPHATSIGSTRTAITSPATSASRQKARTHSTNEKSQTSRQRSPVYDLLSSGPRQRFTVWSAQGPLLVHNCAVIGLGYQMAAPTFKNTLAAGTLGPRKLVEDFFSKLVVDTYRRKNLYTVALWKEAEGWIRYLCAGTKPTEVLLGGLNIVLDPKRKRIWVPNGTYLQYNGLVRGWDGAKYYERRGNAKIWKNLYGGKLIENLVQKLSRDVIADMVLAVDYRYRIVMTTHDELGTIVPKSGANQAFDLITAIMNTAPWWCPTVPVAAELKMKEYYPK